uniref:Putative secreted protein n=1 Tax=Anopheles darlingi TaxID=43151 RepID=A0A2M4D396_ANODA
MWHRYGLTWLCVFFICSVSSSRLRYTLLQTEQMYGFSSLWNFMWFARSVGCANWTPHTMHTSWWVRMCVVRLFFWLNRLPQIVHA